MYTNTNIKYTDIAESTVASYTRELQEAHDQLGEARRKLHALEILYAFINAYSSSFYDRQQNRFSSLMRLNSSEISGNVMEGYTSHMSSILQGPSYQQVLEDFSIAITYINNAIIDTKAEIGQLQLSLGDLQDEYDKAQQNLQVALQEKQQHLDWIHNHIETR